MEYKIALIPGDGIGPEIVAEAKKVLDRVCEKYSHKFSYAFTQPRIMVLATEKLDVVVVLIKEIGRASCRERV